MKRPLLDQWERYEIRKGMPSGSKNAELLHFYRQWRDMRREVEKTFDKVLHFLSYLLK